MVWLEHVREVGIITVGQQNIFIPILIDVSEYEVANFRIPAEIAREASSQIFRCPADKRRKPLRVPAPVRPQYRAARLD